MYYGTYTYLIELILVLQSLFLYLRSYTYIMEHILVLQILYLYYGAYSCILDTEVPVGTTEHFTCTKVLVGSIQIHYMKVPIGTTELILIFQNLYLYYRYRSTRRFHRDSLYGSTRRYIQIFTIFISLLLFFIRSLII